LKGEVKGGRTQKKGGQNKRKKKLGEKRKAERFLSPP